MMPNSISGALKQIDRPAARGLFHVKRLDAYPAYLVGRNSEGHAALLIRASGDGRTVPLRLAGIDARFSTPCRIAEPGQAEATEPLTVVLCLSASNEVEAYFASIFESLLPFMGQSPSTKRVADAVQQLVDLFQKLSMPPTRPLMGLAGELCLIWQATDPVATAKAWRIDIDERFDFVIGRLRLDVKASGQRQRVHGVSFEQANPPADCAGLIASVFIDTAGGGTSLGDFVAAILSKVAPSDEATMRVQSVVASTLGNKLTECMGWRFDLPLAESSMLFFDAADIPAVRPPLPARVSGVRFNSELDGVAPIDIKTWGRRLRASERALLPPDTTAR